MEMRISIETTPRGTLTVINLAAVAHSTACGAVELLDQSWFMYLEEPEGETYAIGAVTQVLRSAYEHAHDAQLGRISKSYKRAD